MSNTALTAVWNRSRSEGTARLVLLSIADRADDKVKFTDDALKTILNVPRVFLPLVLKGCVVFVICKTNPRFKARQR